MAVGQGSLAGFARVSYEAVGLADFANDNQRAETSYRESTRGMSDEAIKLELSQDKLRRALAKGPAAYRELARAELQVRQSERALRGETDALARSQDRQQRSMGRLRGSLLAYGGAFLGGTGVLFAIKSSLAAAREEELVLGQTQVAVEAAGVAWEGYARRIQAVIKVQSALGFDDEELLKTFQLFVRGTKDVDEALKLNALAADISRGRYMDLESAAKLVVKASLGQAGALRRVGIDAKAGATGLELVTLLTEQYGQAAETAADTGIAAQDRQRVAIENLREALGRGLSPTVTEYTDKLTKWLDTAEHQEELQRRVNQAVETGETIVRALGGAFDFLDTTILGPLKKLGLLEEAIQAALIIGLVTKVRRAAGSFGLIAASSAATTAKVTRDAAIAGRALDVAYRPRNVVVTGGGVPAGGGRFSGFGGGASIALILSAIFGPDFVEKLQKEQSEGGQGIGRFFPDYQLWPGGPSLKDLLGGKPIKPTPKATDFTEIEKNRNAPIDTSRPGGSGSDASGGGATKPRRTIADIQLDLARAATTASKADDLRYHRELLARYQAQADRLERRKNLTAKQKELLRGLYGQLASEQAAIDSIITEGEQKIAEQREKAREKRERQREAAAAKQKRLDDFYGSRERMHRVASSRPERESGGAGVKGAGKGGKGDGKGLTEADVRRMQFEFLSGLTGEIAQWGSNFMPSGSGQLETNAHIQTQLMQQQNAALYRLIEGAWHPGAQLASAELSAAGWGVGY